MDGKSLYKFDMRNLSRIIILPVILLMTIFSLAKPSFSSDSSLTLASFNIPPYLYHDDQGNVIGSLVDLLDKASEKSGIHIEYRLTNWSRAQEEVRNGNIDLIFPVVHTQEREAWLEYPQNPVTHFEMTLFSRKINPVAFDGTPTSLHGLRIGKIDKAKMHPMFSKLEDSGKIDVVPHRELTHLIKSVANGRLDSFASPKKMVLWHLEQQNLATITPISPNIGTSAIYLALSKKSKNKESWQKLIQNLKTLD